MLQKTSPLPTDLTTNSLFEEPWWLDAVAPGKWEAVSVERGGRVVARLPFLLRKRYGLTQITQPPLTQTLGPWVDPGEGKYASRLSNEHFLIGELLARIPDCDFFTQSLSPLVTDFLPFHWNGFKTSVRCTYRLESLQPLEAIWTGFTEKCRNTIRKAEKLVSVRDDLEADRFYDIVSKTWARQGLRPSFERELFERVHAKCLARQTGRIFYAIDEKGQIHAAIFLVWDERAAYYLVGGGNTELRNSGAHSLLIWRALQFASTVTRAFDFEGSINAAIEHFCRSFGARQTPIINVARLSRRAAALTALKDLVQVVSKKRIPWFC